MIIYEKEYEIGDEITYDSNIRGVKPRIGKGVIVDKDRTFATRGMSAEDTYKVKKPNGDIVTIDKLMIIEDDNNLNESYTIKEDTDLRDYKKAGYAFKVRTIYSGYIDLFCYTDRKTCKKYYDAFEDTIKQFENVEDDYFNIQDAYEDSIQGVYEAAQRYTSDFYEEIDWRKDIINYKGNEVYLDNFNDKYYIIINNIIIDI